MITEKPLVAYIAYEPLGINYLKVFLKYYEKFDSGHDHDLLICFKQFKSKNNIIDWEKNIKIKYLKFDDSNNLNDFDIGSYFRIAKKYSNRHILFLNTYTRPNTDNWLKIFINNYNKKIVLGATGSLSSLPSLFFNFFFKQHSKIQQIKWGIKHLLHVKLFPNAHLRTTGFFIQAEDLLTLNFDTNKFTKKIETNYFEGGRNGLSNRLIRKGYKLKLVNSDNKSFDISDWKFSQTFYLGNQEKLIFRDNMTDDYNNSNLEEQKKRALYAWGDFNL